jgi:hypothetical protein
MQISREQLERTQAERIEERCCKDAQLKAATL